MMDSHQVVPSVNSAAMEIDVEAAISKLVAYCRTNDWAGYDPYDALNSPLFRTLPFLDYRLPRLLFTQALKRSPVNFRRLLHIPKTQNPKAIALFLSAFVSLERVDAACQKGDDIELMIERLRNLRSPGTDYWCWGYSFPWQTRTILVPSGAPNLVCTSFVANALLDASDPCRDSQCLNMASSAAEYILNELYWTEGGAAGFSYPRPLLRSRVHNANFLAAALLYRVYRRTNDEKFLLPALRVARYSVTKQHRDGSWHYGEEASQRWIDNFHTGYNLCALQAISRYAATTEFDAVLRRGFEFYRSHFFREDGSVRYFHDRDHPIDIHCVAQSILTLLTLKEMDPGNLPLAHSVLRWALTHLWDDRGFFYYRVQRSCTNRVSFMRWSQAWMLLAMATLLEVSRCDGVDEADRKLAVIARRPHD
jgi:hypothetical protein